MRLTKTRRARRSTWTGCWRTASPLPPPSAPAVTAVIAAAGSGERLGAGGPKAFVPVAGRPLIEWSLEAFRACDSVHAIIVAAPPGHEHGLATAASGGSDLGDEGPDASGVGLTFVDGGSTRARSVANALAAVETELVAIHDAARPLLTPVLVEDLVAALAANPDAAAVIPAAPVTDTVKLAAGPSQAFAAPERKKPWLEVERTLDRSLLWGAQTPQVFRTPALREALAVEEATRDAATDEAMLVEQAGGTVLIHPAPPENLKVTTPHDLRVAELMLSDRAASR